MDDIVERSPDGRYSRFNQQLGHGAFKAVFKGYDEEEGIEVAWCQVNMDRVGEAEKAQIHTEVDILKSLTHKHILTFFAYFDLPSTKQIVFITEIMTSGTLKQYIHKAKRVKRKVVKKWCRQILDGLSFLHAKRIIHRDLKCDNIFINGNNSEIKIGDLGLSTLMREGQGQAQSVLGTPEFMAPELYDELYDEKVDIYAFGMCVLEMVTSEYPYSECLNAAQIYRKVTQRSKPASLLKIVDEQTKKFIEECLEHDHGIRPSATALLNHDYLQPPFGGPGTKDDEPVELLPKREVLPKDMPNKDQQPTQQQLTPSQPLPLPLQPPFQPLQPPYSDATGAYPEPVASASTQPPHAFQALTTPAATAVVAGSISDIGVSNSGGDDSSGVALHAPAAKLAEHRAVPIGDPCLAGPSSSGHASPAPGESCSSSTVAGVAASPSVTECAPHTELQLVPVRADKGGPVVTVSPPPATTLASHACSAARYDVDVAACHAQLRGSSCPTPPRLTMSDSHSSVLELTCQVMVEGEHKSVTFSMDFAHDTPQAVAREMVEELRMEESEATITDIVRQIEQFQPMDHEATASSANRLASMVRLQAPPPGPPAATDESVADAPPPAHVHLEPGCATKAHAHAAQAPPPPQQHEHESHLRQPASAAAVPQPQLQLQPQPSELLPGGRPHVTPATGVPDVLSCAPRAAVASRILQIPSTSPPASAGGAAPLSVAATAEVGSEGEAGSSSGGMNSSMRDLPELAPHVHVHPSLLGPAVSAMPPQPSQSQTPSLDGPMPIAAPMSSVLAACSNVAPLAGTLPARPAQPGPQLAAGGACASMSGGATKVSMSHAHAHAHVVCTTGTASAGGGASVLQSGVAPGGGGRPCALDDEDGDMDDNEIMQRIEIQQLREIEEMKERHRKQNTRMIAMIQRRAQERARRGDRGVDAT